MKKIGRENKSYIGFLYRSYIFYIGFVTESYIGFEYHRFYIGIVKDNFACVA
jgi:hypothetical protein